MYKKVYKEGFSRILCVAEDDMGDVIMSSPAFRALKGAYNSHITLLTSSVGVPVTPFIKDVDEVIVHDLPWVKAPDRRWKGLDKLDSGLNRLVERIRKSHFDGAVIFTSYSQNALPTALLLYMAGVPRRLGYCRENPRELLTDWISDQEPFSPLHQVSRNLRLVTHWTGETGGNDLQLSVRSAQRIRMLEKISALGPTTGAGWVVLHPGAGDTRRKYPPEDWIRISRLLTEEQGLQVIVSGSGSDGELAALISAEGGDNCYNAAGILSVGEWIALIQEAFLLISVNTAAEHIAAAVNTPVVVLYAVANPQHTPWKVPSIVLPFADPYKVAEVAGELLTIYTRKA